MEKYSKVLSTLILGISIMISGCDSDSDSDNKNDSGVELEQDGKILIFYSVSTNKHLAYDVEENKLTDLNDDEKLVNFKMDTSEKGKFFTWIDNKGDNNTSNDEEKIVMLKEDYSHSEDGNITWEDFYYLGHFHKGEENGETHHHLAAHANEEFDLSNVPEDDLATNKKYNALERLNKFLASQSTIEKNLKTTLSKLNVPAELCGFKSVTNDNGVHNYAMGKDGKLYIFNNELNSTTKTYGYIDQTLITTLGCETNKMGISAVSHHDEDGVVVFLNNSQKLYLIDSHEGGIYHIHSSYSVSEIIGDGESVEMMTSLLPVGYKPDEKEHEH